jgi:purine-binding chemotaxis protein CheW
MGLTSAVEETESFCALMQQREQDHRNWLNELEASSRPFTLATDPHQCAFGKWYDKFKAENAWVAALLKKFDVPHRQIHGMAIRV